jgi:2-polyprenyl-3-methyl-5-hydroxy-6-metoxy-1,4-benzoquinol methylase
VHYEHCPVCQTRQISPIFSATDYTVSQEQFVVWQCGGCSLRFTQDIPDASSIGPYYKAESYISHTDTRKGLVNRIYQRVRQITLGQKLALVQRASGLQQGRALDVGCGTGAFLNTLKQAGWKAEGIEPDADARAMARQNYGVDVQEASALFTLPKNTFDVITLWHVLEHVHDLHGYIDQLRSLLRSNGVLIIAVPNYTSGDADTYGRNWAAYDVPRHLYHFSPESMRVLMSAHQMKLLRMQPMWFDSFYISLLSSKYRFGQTRWFGAAFAGLRSNLKAMLNRERCSSITYVVGKENA